LIAHSKPSLSNDEFNALKTIYFSNMISSGKEVEKFKKSLSNYLQKEYIEFFSSGTEALYNILLALEIKKNDEVLIPAYICESVKQAVLKIGAKPTFYDNKINSWISSYEEISRFVTKHTKAIIVNHTFGLRYIKDEILCIKELGIPIIEDNAHFISNNKNDIEISNLFDVSFYSFDATKLLTTGNGGAISTNNKYLIKNMIFLDKGLSDLCASIGTIQLKKWEDILLMERKRIADIYLSKISNTKEFDSIYFRFPIIVNNTEAFFNSKKVSFRRGVDKILKDLPNVKKNYKTTISVPIYPTLTKREIQIIIDETNRLLERQ